MCCITVEYWNVGENITRKKHRHHNGCQKNSNDKASKGRKTCCQKSGLCPLKGIFIDFSRGKMRDGKVEIAG